MLATDGARSYAIYTYECGKLNWVKHSAAIGFSASDNFFAEHPLSRTSSVNEIACINIPSSNWANIAYEMTTMVSAQSVQSIMFIARKQNGRYNASIREAR